MKTKSIFKTSIAIILLSLFTLPALSQVKFGIKADVELNNSNFSSLDETFNVENMTSWSIGPSIEAMFIPLGVADFGIEASLLYNDNRMTIKQLTEEGGEKDVANRYLMLPVNAKLKFGLGMLPVRVYAAAGPYAGYLISGDEINLGDIGSDIKAKSFQAGANIGFGLELVNMLQVGLNYRVQLTDNYSDDIPDWSDPLNGKTDTWSITATIYF